MVPSGSVVPTGPPPWLLAAADAEQVGVALSGLLTGAGASAGAGAGAGASAGGGGGGTLPGGAVPVDVRWELLDLRARGATWRVRYRVALTSGAGVRTDLVLVGDIDPARATASAAAGGTPAAGSTGEVGSASWRGWLPSLGLTLRPEGADRRLPAAALLLDPTSARDVLEQALRSRAYPGLRVAGCTPRRVRYAYGARCTVVYDLHPGADSGPGGPAVVVAKAHADGAGAAVDAAMRALWGTGLARGDVVRIAEPLGYLPESGVLVQSAVPGDVTAREVLAEVGAGGGTARAEAVLLAVADGLVALHGCGLGDGPVRTWDDDVARVRRTVARVAPGWPAAAAALGPALDALEAAGGTTAATAPRPAHGAFRPSQVLVDGDRVGFIDFDGFCGAEPERDLGRFCKSLRKAVTGTPDGAGDGDEPRAAEVAEHLVETFLARYAAGAPMSRERVAAWEALDVLAGEARRAATIRADATGLPADLATAGPTPVGPRVGVPTPVGLRVGEPPAVGSSVPA